MSNKNLKEILIRKETTFGEAYNKANAGYAAFSVSEFTPNRVTEKIEKKFLAINKELNNHTTDGRTNGKLTITKPLDGSFKDHLDFTEAGFGTLIQSYANEIEGTITSVVGNTTINVTDAGNFSTGDIIAIGDSNNTLKAGKNIILAINVNEITLKYPLKDIEIASIEETVDRVIHPPVFNVAKTKNNSFSIVCVYSDDSVEVLEGAVPAMSLEIPDSGKMEMKIEVMSASIGSQDTVGTVYAKPTTSITSEVEYPTTYVDFKYNYIYDTINSVDFAICPYKFALKIGHTLSPEKSICGKNGILGYYVKPDITAEVEYARNPTRLALFTHKSINKDEQYVFLSQENFAIFAERARFTGLDLAYMEEYDSLKMNVDVNQSTTKDLLISLPF